MNFPPRFIMDLAGIFSLPDDLIPAIVADPTSQLRYTCKWFYGKIAPDLWKITNGAAISPWYSAKLPSHTQYYGIIDTRNGTMIDNGYDIHGYGSPFMLIYGEVTACISCLLIWDEKCLPFITKYPGSILYKLVHKHTGGALNLRDIIKLDKINPRQLLVVGNCPVLPYTHINYMTMEFYTTNHHSKTSFNVYKKMELGDFAAQKNEFSATSSS